VTATSAKPQPTSPPYWPEHPTSPDAAVGLASVVATQRMPQLDPATGATASMLIACTAALGVPEQRKVIELIHRLRARGVGVLFIAHNLGGIFAVSDRIIVLRRGIKAGGHLVGETNGDDIVRLMVGA
jgi:ABC-type sugar transport system ATPase subunit